MLANDEGIRLRGLVQRDFSRMDAGLREGGGTAYCEHLLPRKAGLSVPFHGIVDDAQPYGPAQEWRGSNVVAAFQLVLPYEDEIRSVEGPAALRGGPEGTARKCI